MSKKEKENIFKGLENTEFFKPSNTTYFGFQSERLKKGSEILLTSKKDSTFNSEWSGKTAIIKKLIDLKGDEMCIFAECVLKYPSESKCKKQSIFVFECIKTKEGNQLYTDIEKVIKY